MKYNVQIKKIEWIDQESNEAEVLFEFGDSMYWAFCCPCFLSEGEKKNVNISFIENDDISFETEFSYKLDSSGQCNLI
ncbi:MAG: hypothetical protein M0P12_07935 [Paludibacteraceae bacterium]|nr:hypothetical protein [Paludibacteraceae bacterium]